MPDFKSFSLQLEGSYQLSLSNDGPFVMMPTDYIVLSPGHRSTESIQVSVVCRIGRQSDTMNSTSPVSASDSSLFSPLFISGTTSVGYGLHLCYLTHCTHRNIHLRLLGILTLQTWFYYNRFHKDAVITKLMVCPRLPFCDV